MDVKSVAEQSEDAVGGEDSDTEHQMAERLEMATDPQVAATELILDAGIGTFGRASLVIGQVRGIGDFDQPAPCALAAISALSAVSRRVLRSITGTRPAARQSSMIGWASYAESIRS